jgi:hypothetical protein
MVMDSKEALRLEVEAALQLIQNALDEAGVDVDAAFEEEADEVEILPGDCSFPIVWSIGDSPCDGEGGEPIDNPMVLRVHSSDELTDPNTKYDISLQDAVNSLIDMIDGDEAMAMIAMQVRDAFHDLAFQISTALEATSENF